MIVGTRADRYFRWFGLHLPLSVKIFLPVVLTTAALAGGLAVVVTGNVSDQVRQAYYQEAETAARGVEVIYLQDPHDEQEINDYLLQLQLARPEFHSIRICSLDSGGTVLASSKPDEVGDTGLLDSTELDAVAHAQSLAEQDNQRFFDIVQPLRNQGNLLGAVVIETSTTAEDQAVGTISLTIAIAAGIAILLESGFVLSALYLGIIRRTRRMQRAVEAVGHGDTSVRLPEGDSPRGRDEIFNLARSVDRMIARVDERRRFDALIRRLGHRALQGTSASDLIAEALNATREALELESCLFASMSESGPAASWRDGTSAEQPAAKMPIWVTALTRVSVEARTPVLTDRLGTDSRLADAPGIKTEAEAAVVPLPRTSKGGQAIVAIAREGTMLPEGGLAAIEAVAATIAETLHMQAAENARAESAVKSKVMAAVSHEMRNPLNSILGFTSLVLGAPAAALTDKQRRQLGHVQTSATAMLALVNNYLDLAKARSGSMVMQYETVNLSGLIGEIVGGMQPQADAKHVIVRVSITGTSARIDPFRTRQVVSNLLSNAIKFTPEGGRIFVRVRAGERGCRIAVSDSGVGIPKAQKGYVFMEFAKIDAGSMAAGKGTGLGLTLTRAYVTAMGGSIRFYSRQGRGTTFVVFLPPPPASAVQAA